jgi:tRNA modification GTPase
MGPDNDTIAAVATPQGIGGVGIVRVSGPDAVAICEAVAGCVPPPRHAHFGDFLDAHGQPIDRGITLRFAAPASYTGEDVVEFQGHGGFIVMDLLLERVLQAGARLARPGEFSERAFLNDRMDLVQAEAVAELIESSTREAARLAMKSLDGEFSRRVNECDAAILAIRTFVEASIDFPEEEIDFLSESDVAERLETLHALLSRTLEECRRGAMLRGGLNVVLCGAPNAGKSSLLNALARKQRAIVSATPGTTRDTVDERILIGGIALNLVDTAGLREVEEDVEREGIRRAREAIAGSDLVLIVVDDTDQDTTALDNIRAVLPSGLPALVVCNKIDLSGGAPGAREAADHIGVSAKSGAGLETLEEALLDRARRGAGTQDLFLARRRHVDAIETAFGHVDAARTECRYGNGELMAESLRLAHLSLGEITGAVTSDDLLGEIFSSFCIGK